jgi:hypothetical protein
MARVAWSICSCRTHSRAASAKPRRGYTCLSPPEPGGTEPRDTPSPRVPGEGGVRGVLATAPHVKVGQETCPSPGSALCAASDLSPQAGRGDWLRGRFFHRLPSSGYNERLLLQQDSGPFGLVSRSRIDQMAWAKWSGPQSEWPRPSLIPFDLWRGVADAADNGARSARATLLDEDTVGRAETRAGDRTSQSGGAR